MTASDLGDGWCGEALGKGDAAIAFEGGWLDPYMQSTFPDIKYAWAPMPIGTLGSPVTISFTAELFHRGRLAEQGPGVRAADLPDGPRGHDQVDRGRRGAAVAVRRADPGRQGCSDHRELVCPSQAPASCPATPTSRRRSRPRSPTRSRTRRSTPDRGRSDQGRDRHRTRQVTTRRPATVGTDRGRQRPAPVTSSGVGWIGW